MHKVVVSIYMELEDVTQASNSIFSTAMDKLDKGEYTADVDVPHAEYVRGVQDMQKGVAGHHFKGKTYPPTPGEFLEAVADLEAARLLS